MNKKASFAMSSIAQKVYKRVRAFTLIELLAVVTIIGILTMIGVQGFANARKRSRDAQRKADLNAIAQALDAYYADTRTYPGKKNGCQWYSSNTAIDPWIPSDTGLPSINQYIVRAQLGGKSILPKDPINSGTNVYYYMPCGAEEANPGVPAPGGLTSSYQLIGFLENKKDPEAVGVDGAFFILR